MTAARSSATHVALGHHTASVRGLRVPVLEPRPGGAAARFAATLGRERHAVTVFAVALLGGFALLAAASIGSGLLLTHVLVHVPGLGYVNSHVNTWLAAHRTPGRTEASLIGSIAAGGVVLPIVAGLVALAALIVRGWRIAAFAVFALAVESGAYRATTLAVHEHRPRVVRLESLPVNASYPSGHTAASLAVYGGLVLLLTSRIRNVSFRRAAWTIAVAIPLYVGLSRMYRGMHHPLDVAGGALLGAGALVVVVFACRCAGAAGDDASRVAPPSRRGGRERA